MRGLGSIRILATTRWPVSSLTFSIFDFRFSIFKLEIGNWKLEIPASGGLGLIRISKNLSAALIWLGSSERVGIEPPTG